MIQVSFGEPAPCADSTSKIWHLHAPILMQLNVLINEFIPVSSRVGENNIKVLYNSCYG